MVNRPKIAGTSAESMAVQYCKEHGWPYAKRLSLSGAKDVGDIDLHPKLTIEVKATQGALKIGPWMDETYNEQIRANADYGILVIKYPGIGARNVGRFLTCMRMYQAHRLIQASQFPSGQLVSERYGVKLEPVRLLRELGRRSLDVEAGEQEMSAVVHQARGQVPDNDYHFMWLEDRLQLLSLAGYGETRHLGKEALDE